MKAIIGSVAGGSYKANSKLPIITSIPNPVPNIVGHIVPTTGRVGVVVAAAVATGQVQSDSDRHCVFLHDPVVAPLVI